MNKMFTFLSRLPGRITRRIQYRITPTILAWKVTITYPFRSAVKPHGLTAPLIVSLTSYPARFSKLPLTLKCLLSQSIAADRVILWIAYQDKNALTPAILDLQKTGLEIAYCDDLRSFKKIIPTLQNYPHSFIVTADDDLYYWPTWLEELVCSYQGNAKEVVCHRAHRIRLGQDGLPLPYVKWEMETQQLDASSLNFQTGMGGVLYPPGVFHADVLKVESFIKLCPQADDIWLYWMMRLNGASARKTKFNKGFYCWPRTQQTALCHNNVAHGGNDLQIKAMLNAYDFPCVPPSSFDHNKCEEIRNRSPQ
jgi:hypothetical protein